MSTFSQNPEREPQPREAAKARVRAKREAEKAMPARERIYWTLHATMTHAEAEALLAEVEQESPKLDRARAELDEVQRRYTLDTAELKKRVAEMDRELGEVIDERDRMHDVADKLAYAVAPIEVIGEHSSENDPWENALDHVTPAAEVDRLREELADQKRTTDYFAQQSTRRLDRAQKAEGERARFKVAWASARQRAQAYGEGIERVVKDRESYQGWLKQTEARVAELEAERDALAKRLHDAAMARVWTNEDGKKFVFVEDIAPALLDTPAGGAS